MSRFTDLVRDYYDTESWIIGNESGGIEAPHVILSVEEEDEKVIAKWQNPETCGLSDCRYHYADTSVHEDVFTLQDGILRRNGETALFNVFIDVPFETDIIKKFTDKWGIKNKGIYTVAA